ncbi:hypothetical protein AB0K40_09905 [Nonomuraea bangladeshensis]|uniref:Uncharacterized protein n=1 Tax=Nonomuraea bangladeshensis TaxID=404385 RepID=A0ABV3GZV0_9ACTN
MKRIGRAHLRPFVEADVTSLLERLALAEVTAAEKAAQLREQLAAAEEELRRLSITRETLLALAAQDDEHDNEPAAEARPGDPARGHEDEPDEPDSPEAPIEVASLPVLRGVRRQAVALLATAQRPMRVRDVVVALGEPDERGKVESMRSRLLRLAADGWLVRCEGGTYALASGVNGHASAWGGGEAPTS